MAEERVERRLTAILAADVVGYSRLMGVDEEGTLAALKMLRREVADPKIKEHRGRIVHTTGDGLLGEFASVVDAVRCAVEVQREMAARNADMPAERRVDFRIGVNLGDIISDEDDIYGDGVNVAARLEALAEPGGICVSRVVRDQVRDKLAIAFEDMGAQQVKNIARPVRAYRILLAERAGVPSILPETAAPRPLPDRPSIAVLPFKNVSGDPEQEYFVDGITEDIITALSKWRWFLVIARNSTFAYKGKSVDLDLNKARMRRVIEALLALSSSPNGFTASEVAARVRALSKQSPSQYGPRHAAYDLKKLRGKHIIRRIGHTRRYEPLLTGLRAMTALLVLRDKAIKPLLAAAQPLRPKRGAHNPKPIDLHYDAIQAAMKGVFHELGLAA